MTLVKPDNSKLELLTWLETLESWQFHAVVSQVNAPPYCLSGEGAPLTQRAMELLNWVLSPSGCGLSSFGEEISKLVEDCNELESLLFQVCHLPIFGKIIFSCELDSSRLPGDTAKGIDRVKGVLTLLFERTDAQYPHVKDVKAQVNAVVFG